MLAPNAPPHITSNTLQTRHAFFGRQGGISTGIYATLNAGTGSNDDATATRENRTRIAAAYALPLTHLTGVHQIHSPTCVRISAPWADQRPHADALVTTKRNLILSILTADCAPILFADEHAHIIGAAHAGWKGALYGVIENTIATMEAAGAERARIKAVIGPCIHQASYEVGPEFLARFSDEDASYSRFFAPGSGDRLHFDLPGFCAHRLETSGLSQIDVLPHDTCADSAAFFSHRRSVHEKASDYGRNCATIAL